MYRTSTGSQFTYVKVLFAIIFSEVTRVTTVERKPEKKKKEMIALIANILSS